MAAANSVVIEANTAGGRRRAVGKSLLQIEGLIKTATSDSIVVINSRGQEISIQIDSATVIRHGGTLLTTDDLHEGDRVHVKVRSSGSMNVAVEINLQNPGGDNGDDNATVTANGTVIAVGASELTLRTVPHGDVVVRVDANTIIKQQGQRIQLSDIRVNWEVNSRGQRVDAQTILAEQIEVRGNSKK